jgi:hypothetical protein
VLGRRRRHRRCAGAGAGDDAGDLTPDAGA